MTSATLYRGSLLVDDLDIIEGFSSAVDGRTLRLRSATAEPGTTPPELIVPRPAGNERGTMRIVFHRSTTAGSPADRSLAVYRSLRLGVVHRLSGVWGGVPAASGLEFTMTDATLEQLDDRIRWSVSFGWERRA